MLSASSNPYTTPIPSAKVSVAEECAKNLGTDEERIKCRKNAGLNALSPRNGLAPGTPSAPIGL
jgi:hypothetical protein